VIAVGCDPHTRTPAFAVHLLGSDQWRLFKLGRPSRRVEEREIREEIRSTLAHYRDGKVAHFVAEDQVIRSGKGSNPHASLILTRARAAVEIAAQDAGMLVSPALHPSTWRARILGIASANPRRHEIAVDRARLITGIRDLDDHDLAEAVCICMALEHSLERAHALARAGWMR